MAKIIMHQIKPKVETAILPNGVIHAPAPQMTEAAPNPAPAPAPTAQPTTSVLMPTATGVPVSSFTPV